MGRKSALGLGGLAAGSLLLPRAKAGPTPRPGGTLKITNGTDPPDFDVLQTATHLTRFLCAPCYSTLFRTDPDDYNKLLPDLAGAMEVAADGLAVTFHIREAVQFHNGELLTADDVAYSIDRIRMPPRGIVSPRKGLLGNIAGVETPDPRTVMIRLKQPQANFLFLISNLFNGFYRRKIVEPLDAIGQGMKRQIVGTGAFRLSRAIDGQLYELVRSEHYFDKPALLDRIQFFPIGGEVERSAALEGKRVDASFFFPNEAVLTTLRKAPGVTALRRPTPTFINIIFNVERKPFDDIRVREAISPALDRSAFIKTVGPLAGAFYHSLGLMPVANDEKDRVLLRLT